MKKLILVGTHHKTGTAWMESVFQQLAIMLNKEFHDISTLDEYSTNHVEREKSFIDEMVKRKKSFINSLIIKRQYSILFDYNSRFDVTGINKKLLGGLHIIRDPRDVVISSARYHTWSKEAWLHIPREEYDGLTYQQKINSIGNFEDQLIFEIDNSSGWCIRSMAEFSGNGVFKTVKYENLIEDQDMKLWHEISLCLGLQGEEIACSQLAFWRNSIFGGKRRTEHIQNGSTGQYREIFNKKVSEYFNYKFPCVFEKMEYDPGSS